MSRLHACLKSGLPVYMLEGPTMITELLSILVSYTDFSTAVLFLVAAYFTWKLYGSYNLPPGPWGLPIVGYLPFLGSNPPEETFNELSKKYGNIMSVYFGSSLVVVLNNFEFIQEALLKQGDNFAGRPQNKMFKERDSDAGVFVTDGEPWREHRRFILSTLRDYGMGKLSLEPKIQEEIHFFLDVLAAQNGCAFDLAAILEMSSANIISALEFGKRFDYKDERFIRYRQLLNEGLNLISTKNPRPFFPWLEKIPFSDRITHLSRLREIRAECEHFISDMINEHETNYHENSRKDLIDAYITEKNSYLKKYGHEGYLNDAEIEGTLMGLFSAGADTTTATLRWALLYMMLYPEVQMKVQKEIDEVIGFEKEPTMSDQNQMPYTEAVLLEVHRCASLAPLNIPHANIEETTINGYRIPKRTMIMTNLWAVHNDPQLWDRPDKLRPERFFSSHGRIEKPEYLLSFGLGKRACIGESLAKMELFLYFTSMLRRFTFKPPDGAIPLLDCESSFVRRPKPYKLCAVQRSCYSG